MEEVQLEAQLKAMNMGKENSGNNWKKIMGEGKKKGDVFCSISKKINDDVKNISSGTWMIYDSSRILIDFSCNLTQY